MAQPYVGEIRMFAGNFPPVGWLFCSGQLLPISENETLFQLIGTTYGGDGESTFGLPNFQSRVPVHMGNGPDGISFQLGELAGVESVTLTTQQMPNHTHPFLATGNLASGNDPSGNVPAASTGATVLPFGTDAPPTALSASSIQPIGGSQAHENCQPFQCINYVISLFGIFPSPT
jgi:microcystin-dependent protein